MRACVWLMLACCGLVGCAGNQRVLRQAVGPGPGPGCVSTLDCACKNGSREACEQLATVAKASRKPKVPQAPKSRPDPIPLPDADQVPSEPDADTKDRCAGYYAKCVAAGGQNLPGRHKSESLCGSCLAYCTSNGFWPEAIYTWNGVRRVCLGQ